MIKKTCLSTFFITFLLWGCSSGVLAQRIELLGAQQSEIQYHLTQDIEVTPGTGELIVSFVTPLTFQPFTYKQRISGLNFELQPPPARQETIKDTRGNRIRTFFWQKPNS